MTLFFLQKQTILVVKLDCEYTCRTQFWFFNAGATSKLLFYLQKFAWRLQKKNFAETFFCKQKIHLKTF